MLLKHREEIFQRAPLLRSVTVTGNLGRDCLDELGTLLDSPAIARLQGLHLSHVGAEFASMPHGGNEDAGDDAMRVVVGSGVLARLRAFGFSDSNLHTDGARHLAASGQLGHLEKLWMNGELEADAWLAIIEPATQVTSLDLRGATDRDAIVARLPAVTELLLSDITDGAITVLGDSRAAATVETLRLFGGLDGAGRITPRDWHAPAAKKKPWLSGRLDGFGRFPRLHTLELIGEGRRIGDVQLGDSRTMQGIDALPSLRRLRLASADPESVLRVARTWGPQLEELVVSGEPAPEVLRQLQRYVAGEVLWDVERVDATLL